VSLFRGPFIVCRLTIPENNSTLNTCPVFGDTLSSSSVLLVLCDYYKKIAGEIIDRWVEGEEYPEKEYFEKIKNPEI
jgi:hypothetical protein